MHIFDLKTYVPYNETIIFETNKPIQTINKVHGKIGIQNFIVVNSKLISAGRDGMLRFYELNKHKNIKLLYILHKQKMPMDWISGHLKSFDDILILGFKEVYTYIYICIFKQMLYVYLYIHFFIYIFIYILLYIYLFFLVIIYRLNL